MQLAAQAAFAEVELTGHAEHVRQLAGLAQQQMADLRGDAGAYLATGQQRTALGVAELDGGRIGARQGLVEQGAGKADAVFVGVKLRGKAEQLAIGAVVRWLWQAQRQTL